MKKCMKVSQIDDRHMIKMFIFCSVIGTRKLKIDFICIIYKFYQYLFIIIIQQITENRTRSVHI